jgi:hypothetical protein
MTSKGPQHTVIENNLQRSLIISGAIVLASQMVHHTLTTAKVQKEDQKTSLTFECTGRFLEHRELM